MSLFGAQAAMGVVNHAFMYTMTENTQNVNITYNVSQQPQQLKNSKLE